MRTGSFLNIAGAIILSPLLGGIVIRVKAFFAGRKGAPLFQIYFDLAKLFGKGFTISRTTTFVFWLAPAAGTAAIFFAAALAPLGRSPAVLPFAGDFILLAGLLGLARFLTILAALDTGSSFEGMGASREAFFSAMAEPALLAALAGPVFKSGRLSLSDALPALAPGLWGPEAPAVALLGVSLFLVFLAENARIPFDDPATHLELTMIHEAMVLDHGGPLLGFIQYGSCLKMWVTGSLVVSVLLPSAGAAEALAGLALLGMAAGLVESVAARLKLSRVPPLLVGAGATAVLGTVLLLGAAG